MKAKEILDEMFLKGILKDATDNDLREIELKQNSNTRNRLLLVSALFALMGLAYLIIDITAGRYSSTVKFRMYNLSAVLVMLISSVLCLIYCILVKRKRHVQYIAFIYNIVIQVSAMLLLTAALLKNQDDFIAVFFNFILLNLCPIYIFPLSITQNLHSVGITTLIIALIKPHWPISRYQHPLMILIALLIATQYLRIVKTKGIYQQVKLEKISKEFEYFSTRDFLTKLSNRTALDNYLKNDVDAAIKNNQYVSITMLDIDDFKTYNDFYSHMAGDVILRKIGGVIGGISNQKFHAFRYGGEEFLVVGIDCSLDELNEVNSLIIDNVRGLRLDRKEMPSVKDYITISAGSCRGIITSMPDFMNLLKIADNRLYQSKRSGKDKLTMN